jgi:hypothetical protein
VTGVPFPKTLELRVQVLIKRQNRVLTIPTVLRHNVVGLMVLAFIDKYCANSKISKGLPPPSPALLQGVRISVSSVETMPAIELDGFRRRNPPAA